LLGPTTYQQEFLVPLQEELFARAALGDGVAQGPAKEGLPLFMKTLQKWLGDSERLVEVSSGRPITDCMFVKVDSEDVVEEVITWGRMCI